LDPHYSTRTHREDAENGASMSWSSACFHRDENSQMIVSHATLSRTDAFLVGFIRNSTWRFCDPKPAIQKSAISEPLNRHSYARASERDGKKAGSTMSNPWARYGFADSKKQPREAIRWHPFTRRCDSNQERGGSRRGCCDKRG